jgi:hypothetical protein
MSVMETMFWDRPPTTMRTEQRTGEQQALEQRRVAVADALSRQYQQANADPNFALPGVAQQRMTEQELVDSVFNRLGESGGLGSGFSRQLANKAIVDYRLKLIKDQQAAREKLRGDIISVMGQQGQPFQIAGVPGKQSTLGGFVDSYASAGGSALGQGLSVGT